MPGTRLLATGPLAIVHDESVPVLRRDGTLCALLGELHEPAGRAPRPAAPIEGKMERLIGSGRDWDEQRLASLRGRFALVRWDDRRRTGQLVCDLLATQPVFYRRGVGHLAFASELPTLLSLLEATPAPDDEAFLAWLGGWTVAEDRTLYEGISRLAPGERIDLTGEGRVCRYWRPGYSGVTRGSRADLADGLRHEVERAVGRRLSSRSSGVVLSGGLDSSIVTALAERGRPPDSTLSTYSAVFPGAEYDEGWKVRKLSASLGVPSNPFELEPQGSLWLNLDHLRRWRLPLAGSGALIDMSAVALAAGDGVEVVLDGQTGDELFGCSPWLVADRLLRGRPLGALALARRWPGKPTNLREQRYILRHWGLRGAAPRRLHRLAQRRKGLERLAPAWMLPDRRRRFAELVDPWAWKARSRGPQWWRYLADVLVYAPHRELRLDYLRDRAARVGVRAETPLYDADLIEYVLRLPPELAFDAAHTRPLARESVRGLVPDEVRLNTEKAVFSPFCFEMLTGADAAGIEHLIAAPNAELGAYVDLGQVRRLWREERPRPGAGFATAAWGTLIWRFAAAESWLRSLRDPFFTERMLADPVVPLPAMKRCELRSSTFLEPTF